MRLLFVFGSLFLRMAVTARFIALLQKIASATLIGLFVGRLYIRCAVAGGFMKLSSVGIDNVVFFMFRFGSFRASYLCY